MQCTSPLLAQSRHAAKRVVMLFDESPELPGLAALDAEFTRTLESDSANRFELYREAMDLSRFGSKTYENLRDVSAGYCRKHYRIGDNRRKLLF